MSQRCWRHDWQQRTACLRQVGSPISCCSTEVMQVGVSVYDDTSGLRSSSSHKHAALASILLAGNGSLKNARDSYISWRAQDTATPCN